MSKRSVVVAVALVAFGLTALPFAQVSILPAQARDPSLVSGPRTQPVPIGTGQIMGTVTAATGGAPLRRAVVRLSGPSRVSPQEAAEAMGRGQRGGGAPAPGRGAAAPQGDLSRGGVQLNRSTVSDASGRFSFDRVPAGQYTLSVTRDQFLALNYGEKQYGRPGAPFSLDEGQRKEFQVRMMRGGAIGGVVLGEDGQPQSGAQVRAARYSFNGGFRRLNPVGSAVSDDRGFFRVFGLVPGDYIISAIPNRSDLMNVSRVMEERTNFDNALAALRVPNGTAAPRVIAMAAPDPTTASNIPAGYLPTYFPGVPTSASASLVALRPGEEREGITIQVLAVQGTNVTGTVAGLPPEFASTPVGSVQVFARSDDNAADAGTGLMLSGIQPDGTFVVRDLAPGRYTIHAQTVQRGTPARVGGAPVPAPEYPRLSGRVAVTIDGVAAPAPVSILLAPGRTVSGRVVSPDDGQPFRGAVTLLPEPTASPVPQFSPIPQAQAAADGTFTLADVIPGRYLFRLPTARSAMVDGKDALDFAFEVPESRDVTDVTITIGRPAVLSGHLTEAGGAPTVDYTIIMAPTDPRYWIPQSRRIVITRPGLDGAFRFPLLPPGSYMLAALSDLEPGAQFDPQVLKELAAASLTVTLTEGATQTQDIRLAR